jgi:hypothetical protein
MTKQAVVIIVSLAGMFAVIAGILAGILADTFGALPWVSFRIGLITALVISALALYQALAYMYPHLAREVVGKVERATGRDWDGDGDMGNDGISDGIAHLSSGMVVHGIDQAQLDKLVKIMSLTRGMPEEKIVGGGRVFQAGKRADFVAVREQFVAAGLLMQEGTSTNSPYRLTDRGQQVLTSHWISKHTPHSPTEESADFA